MEVKKSISVIIPNYNGRQLLEEYLPFTLGAIKNAGVDHEIIIIDDCSTDNSVAFIQKTYPDFILLVNEQNKGFSFSCNRGIKIAQCELVLLLNPDVKLAPDYFEHQWKYFLGWNTFGVMGRIIGMDDDIIQDAARVPKLNGFKIKTDYLYYTGDGSDRLLTLYLSGANALIDAAKLKKIGGFYEIFSPFYHEDMELSLRAWRLRWKCYYEHNAICRHGVSTIAKNFDSAEEIKRTYYRNWFYLHAIHLNGWALKGWYLQITIVDLIPKLLAGQKWIWESYKDLFKNQQLIKQYKTRVKVLMDDNDSYLSVFDIIKKVKLSVHGRRIFKLKAPENTF